MGFLTANTVNDGKIFYQNFFKFDEAAFSVLTHNVGQLLMFVMPIVFFALAIVFSKRFIQMVKKIVKKMRRKTSKDDYQYEVEDDERETSKRTIRKSRT
ncbi:MAG: hypothetical protein H0X63_12415 [Flavobacteriales bacterium]|jgi:hypothetical protein|nr:hypothetical protein [Flavobacteriales bacterium]